MQRELTITLSEETYTGLIKLAGEQNASQFIEAVLRPYVSELIEEFEVKLPLNDGQRKIYIHSPHLPNRALADRFKMELIEENVDA